MTCDRAMLSEVIRRFPAARGAELWHGSPSREVTTRRVVPLIEHRGFSGAVIVRIRAGAGEFCLRGWPPAAPPVERIRGLHRLLKFVREAGVGQVPVPLATDDGETLVRAGGRWWQVEPWMPGTADYRQNPGDTRLRNVMAALAAFHQAAARFEALPAEQEWFACDSASPSPAVLERREQLRLWWRGGLDRLQRQLAAAPESEFRRLGLQALEQLQHIGPSIARQLDAAAGLRFPLIPCIRDVWHDHVLFTNDEVTGLVDLAACRCENVAADLARLLGSLVTDDARQWDIALEAYGRQRPLSLDEVALIPVLDRSGVLLSGLTWLERRYLREDESIDVPRVRARLSGIVERLRRMPAV